MAAVKADYYEVLGVSRDADEETIRRAFHTRARDCHPDVSDAPEDHRRFRELAEAYRVLAKPASRLLYDRYGYRGRGNQGFDEELWESRERPPRGENVHARVELQSYEANEGTTRLVRYEAPTPCAVCDGWGVIGDPVPNCPECGGTGQRRQVSHLDVARILRIEACPECGVDPCDECDGTGVVVAERRLRVRIPAGNEDGTQLRVAGEGGAGGPGGVPGDLVLDVDVRPEPLDLPIVRWLALAGMVAAIALLVAYLLLR
jgi:molecular chaperone DnaJ